MRAVDDSAVVSRDSSLWRTARRAWAALKAPLETTKCTEEEAEDEPVMTLELCAMAECECHFHRPLHPMRVCTGCHLIAYCNAKCQQR